MRTEPLHGFWVRWKAWNRFQTLMIRMSINNTQIKCSPWSGWGIKFKWV